MLKSIMKKSKLKLLKLKELNKRQQLQLSKMIKNGEINMTRAMPRPRNGRSIKIAIARPKRTVIARTEPTKTSVFSTAGQNRGSV